MLWLRDTERERKSPLLSLLMLYFIFAEYWWTEWYRGRHIKISWLCHDSFLPSTEPPVPGWSGVFPAESRQSGLWGPFSRDPTPGLISPHSPPVRLPPPLPPPPWLRSNWLFWDGSDGRIRESCLFTEYKNQLVFYIWIMDLGYNQWLSWFQAIWSDKWL